MRRLEFVAMRERAARLRWWRDRAKSMTFVGCITYCLGFFLDWGLDIESAAHVRWAGAVLAAAGAAGGLLWLVDATLEGRDDESKH